jgi:hypothetical protein
MRISDEFVVGVDGCSGDTGVLQELRGCSMISQNGPFGDGGIEFVMACMAAPGAGEAGIGAPIVTTESGAECVTLGFVANGESQPIVIARGAVRTLGGVDWVAVAATGWDEEAAALSGRRFDELGATELGAAEAGVQFIAEGVPEHVGSEDDDADSDSGHEGQSWISAEVDRAVAGEHCAP